MKIFGVRDFIENWEFHSCQSNQCVVGSVLFYHGQLLLLDEGTELEFYKGNARLTLECDGADIMLRKLLPKLGGGPSSFWEAAVVEVDSMQILDEVYVITPKRLHYWDFKDKVFVPLIFDEDFIKLERAKEAELSKARAEIVESGEVDPFSSAGKHVADYWADKL